MCFCVSVHKELKDDFAVLGKAICNGSPQKIARAVLKSITLRKIVVERVLQLMNTQLNAKLCVPNFVFLLLFL